MPARFTLDLDILRGVEDFNAFIIDLRQRLAVGDAIEGIPILAPEVHAPEPVEFFDVNLSSGEAHTVQLRFRTDNLYLVGYFPPDGNNVWYELKHEDGGTRTLINENNTTTQLLPFGDNYNDMEWFADRRLSMVPLSAKKIVAAIGNLQASFGTDSTTQARAILTILFTISEAARFRDISSLIANAWGNESAPGTQYANRVRKWDRLSCAVQRARLHRHGFDFDVPSTGISSFVEAILSLGIMHWADPKILAPPKQSITDASESSDGQDRVFAQGQPLLEILKVEVMEMNGEGPGDFYGTITVTDSTDIINIWNCPFPDTIAVSPHQNLQLTGPSRAVSAADEFYIKFDLWECNTFTSNNTIATGTIAYNALDYFTQPDVVQHRIVNGSHGKVEVSYVPITDGLYAQIEVIFANGPTFADAGYVYGEITANNGHGDSSLLRQPSDNCIHIYQGNPLVLSRSVVAVPTNKTLTVTAHLWAMDYSAGLDAPPVELAWGLGEFTPLYKQSETQDIPGSSGKVTVNVSWM